MQELQDEIHTFQDKLDLMNEVCQEVMTDTNAQNQRLIQQALTDLNERLSTLENEAQQKEQELVERSRQHQIFQVMLQANDVISMGMQDRGSVDFSTLNKCFISLLQYNEY